MSPLDYCTCDPVHLEVARSLRVKSLHCVIEMHVNVETGRVFPASFVSVWPEKYICVYLAGELKNGLKGNCTFAFAKKKKKKMKSIIQKKKENKTLVTERQVQSLAVNCIVKQTHPTQPYWEHPVGKPHWLPGVLRRPMAVLGGRLLLGSFLECAF